ncbi:hypothetical protein [Bradyrhizobium sp. USDA 4501]
MELDGRRDEVGDVGFELVALGFQGGEPIPQRPARGFRNNGIHGLGYGAVDVAQPLFEIAAAMR